jgi:cell division protein FtsW (lipid II flippase)
VPIKQTLKREYEVAFSKNPQPARMRILKYFLLALLIYFLRGSKWLWIILLALFTLAVAIHFWYRYKTHGWTKSYGKWKHEDDQSGS